MTLYFLGTEVGVDERDELQELSPVDVIYERRLSFPQMTEYEEFVPVVLKNNDKSSEEMD